MSYWDTSCLIKLYVVESDSAVFRQHVQNRKEPVTTCELARLEFMTAMRRKEAEGEIVSGAADRHVAHFDSETMAGSCLLLSPDAAVRTEFEDIVKRCYSSTPPIFLRTLDALHLATAVVAAEREFVATDRRLRDAAALLGFQLFPLTTP